MGSIEVYRKSTYNSKQKVWYKIMGPYYISKTFGILDFWGMLFKIYVWGLWHWKFKWVIQAFN